MVKNVGSLVCLRPISLQKVKKTQILLADCNFLAKFEAKFLNLKTNGQLLVIEPKM